MAGARGGAVASRAAAVAAAAVAALALAGCAGSSAGRAAAPPEVAAPAPPPTTPPIPTGPARSWLGPVLALESAPCLKPDERNWRAAERDKVTVELSRSGLEAAAARLSQRLSEVYPDAQVAALARASTDGRCRRIVYRADGLRVVGFILEPFGAQPRSTPGVLYARGGNREAGAIGPALLSHLQAIADRGFAAVGAAILRTCPRTTAAPTSTATRAAASMPTKRCATAYPCAPPPSPAASPTSGTPCARDPRWRKWRATSSPTGRPSKAWRSPSARRCAGSTSSRCRS